MPEFEYTARQLDGQQEVGLISAASEREVVRQLAGRSLFPLQVRPIKSVPSMRAGRVSRRIIAIFYTQLASLLRSGVPLLRSLAILREQASHAGLQAVLNDVYDRVEEGETLYDAMRRHPRVFSEMAVNMIHAGSEGGFLEEGLDRVAQFTDQQEDLKSRTVGALVYPIFLAVVGTIIVTVLIIFFVPKFEELFDRLRQQNELPLLTESLLNTSQFLQSYGWIVLLIILFLGLLLRGQFHTRSGRRRMDQFKLQLPVFGNIVRNLAIARFCRVLGTLLRNGVPILKSLEISQAAAGNMILAEAVTKASENISSGQSLAGPLQQSGQFPKLLVEMIAVGEESNTLEQVLVDIADTLERTTVRRLDLIVRLFEPVLLLILAGIVLMVVVALLVPVLRMSSTI